MRPRSGALGWGVGVGWGGGEGEEERKDKAEGASLLVGGGGALGRPLNRGEGVAGSWYSLAVAVVVGWQD